MSLSKRQQTAQAISILMPHIMQGAHLGVFAKRAMTQTQFLILVSLHSKGACTMSEIAAHLKVSMPTVTGLVNRLVEAKYLKRDAHPKDRRQIVIDLTPKAQLFLKDFKTIIAQRWTEVLAVLNDEQLMQFYAIIQKLSTSMAKKEI